MAISAPFPYRHCLRPLSHGLRRASSPIGGAKGGCAAGFPPTCPLRRRISFVNVRYCIVGAMRRRCFPIGETTGRLIAAELLCDRPRRSLDFDSLRGAQPLRTLRNFRSVIQWHPPCRGGYQPPANVANFWAEPYWPSDVIILRIFHVSTLYHRISFANVGTCIVDALRRRYFPYGEITGRILSAPTNAPKFPLGDSVASAV